MRAKHFAILIWGLGCASSSQAGLFKFFRACEEEVSIENRPPSEGELLGKRVLGLLDPRDPFRESRLRFMETSRDVKTAELELERLTALYDRLVPTLTLTYTNFTKRPSVSEKENLEVALLQVEILLDQIQELCRRMEHAVAIRVEELRSGLVRRPDIMRQLPADVVEQLRNPASLNDIFKAMSAGSRLGQLEVSVLEEFNMISFFIGLRGQIAKSIKEGLAPVLQEKIRAVNQLLGRGIAQRTEPHESN